MMHETGSLGTTSCEAKPGPATSCEICALMVYYTAQSGNSLPMFWDNLSLPSSNVNKSKAEQSMMEVN